METRKNMSIELIKDINTYVEVYAMPDGSAIGFWPTGFIKVKKYRDGYEMLSFIDIDYINGVLNCNKKIIKVLNEAAKNPDFCRVFEKVHASKMPAAIKEFADKYNYDSTLKAALDFWGAESMFKKYSKRSMGCDYATQKALREAPEALYSFIETKNRNFIDEIVLKCFADVRIIKNAKRAW